MARKTAAGKTPPASPQGSEVERIKRFIRAKGEQMLEHRNVTSLGIGYKEEAGKSGRTLALQFTVERKVALESLEAVHGAPIPASYEFEGMAIPTDVIQRSYKPSYIQVALEAKSPRKSRVDPVLGGVSISHVELSAGTLGAVVQDAASGEVLLLSNWHVLCGATGKEGDTIVQPGPFDDSQVQRNKLGVLRRSHLGLAGDCAVASLAGRKVDTTVLELGVAIESIGKPELGDLVVKSGRTTGVTYGEVTRIETLVKMPYEGMGIVNISGFEIGPSAAHPADGDEISKGGDSGAAWLAANPKTGKPTSVMLGLHFGGDVQGSDGEFALACSAQAVFQKLEITPLDKTARTKPGKPPKAGKSLLQTGFQTGFLDFEVALPTFSGKLAKDLIGLDGTDRIDYCHYSVWLSKSRKLARCVAWNIDGNSKKSLSRKGIAFSKDTRGELEDYQLGDELYASNDLDRGHVARRDDLVWGSMEEAQQANLDSFYFSNMTPQHKAFNQASLKGKWGELEDAILDEVVVKDLKVSLWGGPILDEDDRPYRGTRLPDEFWKVVFFTDDADGSHKARAFILSQKDLLGKLKPEALELEMFRWYQVPLATVEARCGFKFDAAIKRYDAATPQGLGSVSARLVEAGRFFEI